MSRPGDDYSGLPALGRVSGWGARVLVGIVLALLVVLAGIFVAGGVTGWPVIVGAAVVLGGVALGLGYQARRSAWATPVLGVMVIVLGVALAVVGAIAHFVLSLSAGGG